LVVLARPEDARAAQTVALRLERAVVDRLRLLDLAERPGQDLFRAGERDADRIEHLRRRLRVEEIHDLLVHAILLIGVLDNPFACRVRARPARNSGSRGVSAAAYLRHSAASGSRCGVSSAL